MPRTLVMRGSTQKTFFCVFCEDAFCFVVGDSVSFKTHFEMVHKTFSEYEILLAVHFIEDYEKKNIIANVLAKLKGERTSQEELDGTGETDNAIETVKKTEQTYVISPTYKSQQTQTQSLNDEKQIETQNININQQFPSLEFVQTSETCKEIQTQENNDIDDFQQQFQTEQKNSNPTVNSELVVAEYLESACGCNCTKCKKCLQKLPIFTCIKCGMEFKREGLLNMHSKKKWGCKTLWRGSGKIACNKCDKVFRGKRGLEIHTNMKYSCILERKKVCGICGKEFKFPIQLEQHNKKINACYAESKCDNCGKVFKQKGKFERHTENRNKYGCDRKCKSCGKELRSSKYLAIHLKDGCKRLKFCMVDRSKVMNLKNTNKCEICLTTFKTNTGLRVHRKREMKCDPRLECGLCGLKLLEEKYLIHIGKPCKVLECQTCGKKFEYQSDLKRHKKRNEGVGRNKSCAWIKGMFPCESCYRFFQTKHYLLKHMSKKHNEIHLMNPMPRLETNAMEGNLENFYVDVKME